MTQNLKPGFITNNFRKAIQTHLILLLISAFALNISTNAQTITSVNPLNGNVGSIVNITGTNFNTTSTNNIVFFGATRATVINSTISSIVVSVPYGATFGPVSVLNISTGLTARSLQFFNPTFSPNKDTITTADIINKVDFSTGIAPSYATIGDLDNDGKSDIVVANSSNGPNISILRNTSINGVLSFATKLDITTSAQPYSIALSDIDGDGKLDIIIANQYSTNISILRNISTVGVISFATILDFNIASAYSNSPPSITVGDFNGDSKPDIAAMSTLGSGPISIIRNTSSVGTISFATQSDFSAGNNISSLAVGDIDGDGKIDIAVANSGVSILRNTSSTNSISFATKVDFSAEVNPNSIAIGDLDGDNKLDIAVANYSYASGGHNISILRNTSITGTINFAPKLNYYTGTNPASVSIGDINGDGKPDIAVANRGNATLSILKNAGTSGVISFSPKLDKTTGLNPNSVVIGDLNSDGKPELIVANSGASANSISVFRNNPLIPQITLNGTLSSFESCLGSASAQQTFTIRGKNLVSNINLSAPNGFEISKFNGTGFTSNLSIAKVSDSVPLTTIYVRLANSASGSPSGQITFTSTWAPTENLTISSLIKQPSSSNNYLSICPSELPFVWNGLTFDSASTKTKSGLFNSVGCDSSATLNLTLKSVSSSTNNLSICPSQLPFVWNGLTFDSASTKTKSGLVNSVGCDSSATLNLTLKPVSLSISNLSICPSQLPYVWNGLTFDSAGTKTKSGLVNSVGCDSSATLNLTLKPVSSSTNNLSICPSQLPFVWNDLTFDSAGTKTKSGLVNSVGCDSSATLNLSLFTIPNTGIILGPKTNLVTSTSYTYTVSQQVGVTYNWSIQNGSIVSGQSTNQISVQFINSGIAKIQAKLISTNGCEDSSFIDLTIGSVGLNEVYLNNSVKIFPNPTSNHIVVEVESKFVGCEFIITDLNGRTVFKRKIETVKDYINIEHLANGLYLMKINAGIPPLKVLKL